MLTMQAPPAATPTAIRCYGEQGAMGEPLCDGPDVRHVRVQVVDGSRFDTAWCADCRADATAGNTMTIIDEAPESEYHARVLRAIRVTGDPHADVALAPHREALGQDAELELAEFTTCKVCGAAAYHDRRFGCSNCGGAL